MKDIGLQTPHSGLPCYMWWNDEKITLDEYDEIWWGFMSQSPITFRNEKVIVMSCIEEVTDIQNIHLNGEMIKYDGVCK